MRFIRTTDGHLWCVKRLTRLAIPVDVVHAEPYLRGSMIEAWVNLGLRIHALKAELWDALPRPIRCIIPFPKAWWVVLNDPYQR